MSDVAIIHDAPEKSTDVRTQVAQMGSGVVVGYSSLKADDQASRVALYNATSGSTPLEDQIGVEFALANIVVTVVTLPDMQTKVPTDLPRVILIDDKGNAYHAISGVLFDDVQKALNMLGEPHEWTEPVYATVNAQRSNNGRRFFTLALRTGEPAKAGK